MLHNVAFLKGGVCRTCVPRMRVREGMWSIFSTPAFRKVARKPKKVRHSCSKVCSEVPGGALVDEAEVRINHTVTTK